MRSFLKISIATLLITSCATGVIRRQIADYELRKHQIKIDKIIQIGQSKPFLASDSLAICKTEFERLKSQLILVQQNNIDSLKVQIERAQSELETAKSDAMRKIMLKGIKSMEYKVGLSAKIIDMYENEPQQTSLALIYNKIINYQQMPDSLLAYTVSCSFSGRQGALPTENFERCYLIKGDSICAEIIVP